MERLQDFRKPRPADLLKNLSQVVTFNGVSFWGCLLPDKMEFSILTIKKMLNYGVRVKSKKIVEEDVKLAGGKILKNVKCVELVTVHNIEFVVFLYPMSILLIGVEEK